MDSVQVFVAMAQQQAPPQTGWDILIEFVSALALVSGPLIAAYALWLNKQQGERLKAMDMEEGARQREFLIAQKVSERALEVLNESFYLTHQVNTVYNIAHEDLTGDQKSDLHEQINRAWEYWGKNMYFLPPAVRKHVYPLTRALSSVFSGGAVRAQVQPKVWEETEKMFRDIEEALTAFMDRYNYLHNMQDPAART